MRYLLAAALGLTSCQADTLQQSCTAPCYTGSPEHRDVGSCLSGTVICDDERNVVGCDGEVHPVPETCNGLDDDCDGMADEVVIVTNRPGDTRVEAPADLCLTVGECRNPWPRCLDAAWTCSYRATVELPEETRCDGLDNDCDGRVDDLPVNGFCYSGPVGTEHGECRPGWLTCAGAEWVCAGEELPTPELPCNGIDEDCDGAVDEGFEDTRVVDVMIAIDISGSMGGFITAVVGALDAHGGQFVDNPNFRWALVTFSEAGDGRTSRLEVPFGDIEPVRARLRTLALSGGTEPSIDVAHHACEGAFGAWRPEAEERLLLMFADEPPQTVEARTAATAGATCAGAAIVPHIWTSWGLQNAYDQIAGPGGGATYTLTNGWQPMLTDLQGVIGDTC